MTDQYATARALLLGQKYGVLSTHSVTVPGYPFGSVTPYCLDRAGKPMILISTIAQHTRNIMADAKVSLTIMEDIRDDVQAHGRLTYLADAVKVDVQRDDSWERYERFFPASRGYHETHDFMFYRLEPVRIRFIGGFGEIYWVDPADVTRANPFTTEQELMIVNHMNDDHQAALRHYLDVLKGIRVDESQPVVMAGIDGEGFDVLVGTQLIRFVFEHSVTNMDEARQALVALARR
jgi:hypothetical protein